MIALTRHAWLPAALTVVVTALLIDVFHQTERIGIDFHTYEAAARVGLQQGWSHIYDQAVVAAEQKRLVPEQYSQPFLSPPPVAWLAAALAPLPYSLAFDVWAALVLAAFAFALAWSATGRGLSRWLPVAAALSPWWVLHAVRLGQVVPLVAAAVVVAWRLVREDREVAGGLVLALVFLKPNTAILVPFALLVAGRYKAVAAWAAGGAAIALVALLTLGVHGLSAYASQVSGPLPAGADALTLKGALGIGGVLAMAVRLLIVGTVLVSAFKLRRSPGLVIPMAIVGSLVASPYLHASDLCLLAAAAWMVWQECPTPAWRVALAAGWVLASPYLFVIGIGPGLNRWPLLELVTLGALVLVAWRPLTREADLRTRAPA